MRRLRPGTAPPVENQRLSMNAHFTKGGTILYRKKSVTMVRMELKTPLNRFDFIHCTTPMLDDRRL